MLSKDKIRSRIGDIQQKTLPLAMYLSPYTVFELEFLGKGYEAEHVLRHDCCSPPCWICFGHCSLQERGNSCQGNRNLAGKIDDQLK